MRRRICLARAAGALAAALSAARNAQAQPAAETALPVVGFLGATGPNPDMLTPLLEGLGAAGWRDGHNVRIEYRG